jgi:hypothetical protein
MKLPTIYLSNAAAVAAVARGTATARTRESVGSGPAYSIMRFPRDFELAVAAGQVLALTPPRRLAAPAIEAKHAHDAGEGTAAAWAEYEAALREIWERPAHFGRLSPGLLAWGAPAVPGERSAAPWDGSKWIVGGPVADGSTLFCACSREAASAGRCHRVIAAPLLARAGWRVILDGSEVS